MVSQVMTRNVQSVSPRESLRRAAQLMDDLNVGALPVCDGERLVGMVTDRDITVRGVSAGLAPDDAAVDAVMSTDVRWCFEDQPVDEVMRQMADTQIRRVPVLSHDDAPRLVGIVSLGDIATDIGGSGGRQHVGQVLEQLSSPSEPDRTARVAPTGTASAGSAVGTATGFVGSNLLADRMHPDTEASSTGDPADAVEVTPDQLVNRNAPGSTSLSPEGAGRLQGLQDGVTVRHVGRQGDDTSTGESGAPGGIDAAGPSGASGGTAGTAGSAGSAGGATP
ncbi:MAG TPA: CBS domain-containing protein [Noviherbaspirillum sp.]|uniref:CBS domain-containing protein n=1 Tax=Noviherbaspirillum sp. TaxID=1926288 RepID=UPI002F925636